MKTSKILLSSLLAAAAMSTGAHAATLADAVLSVDAFNDTAVKNLKNDGWVLENISGTDTGVFTSTTTQATIAAGTTGKTFTTSTGGRNTYSVVFTVNKSAFEALTSGSYNDGILVSGKKADGTYTGNVGTGLKAGNITGAWNDGSWDTLKIANATNYADANDLITIGFVYNSGDTGSNLYVLNTDGTTTTTGTGGSGLRGAGNIITAVLSNLSGISYSNLYWFNTALSAADMTSAMTTVGSGYVWAGTSAGNVWNTTSTNWLKDSASSTFTSGSSAIFGNAAESKSVVIDSAITAANVSVLTDYSFVIKEGGSLTADSIGVSSGATLDISGAGTLAGALTKAGAGTLTLSGANTYSGKTTISAGTLVVKNESALGTGNISISAGGELKLDIGSSATMTQGAGSISGDYSTNAKLTIASGKLVLTSATNDFRGTVDILTGGILELNSGAKLLKTYSNSFVWIRSGGELRMTSFAYDALGASPDYAQYRQIDGGRISITGDTSTSGQGFTVTENGGEFLMEKSGQTLTLDGNANSNIIVLNGALKIGGAGDIVINKHSSQVAIAGNGSLEKVGAGTLTINSSGNTYDGGTTVTQGKLVVGSSEALGTGTVSVAKDAKLQLGADALAIGTLSGAGTIGLATGTTSSTLTVNQTADGTFSGSINGELVSIVKNGTGTLDLSGYVYLYEANFATESSSYADVAVNAGTLKISGHAAAGKLSVASGATLGLVGNAASFQSVEIAEGAKIVVDMSAFTDKAETFTLELLTTSALKYNGVDITSEVGTLLTNDVVSLSGWDKTGWTESLSYASDTNTLKLTMTIPEPSTFGLLAGVGALALVVARRRRRAK